MICGAIWPLSAPQSARAQSLDQSLFTPAAPVVYDWSGAYAGLSAGATWETFETLIGTPSTRVNLDADGFSGGVYGGMNFSSGPVVFGVEIDASFTTGKDTAIVSGVPVTAQSDWFSTLRGRAGYALDRYLIYGTGGLAAGNVSIGTPAGSANESRFGWTIGAGVEAALNDRFTLRGEYLYTDLGSVDGTVGGSPFSAEFDSHTLRAGVTYRFD